MPTMLADLRERFREDVDWFNGHLFNPGDFAPAGRFHPDIEMKRIDDPTAYHTGFNAVRDYFTMGPGSVDNAWFWPMNNDVPDYKVLGGARILGVVSGTADFIYRSVNDRYGPPTSLHRITYSFTYVPVGAGAAAEWKAIHLWGKYL
jgi:hypothetical protein